MKRYPLTLIFLFGIAAASGSMAKELDAFGAPASVHMTLDGNMDSKTRMFAFDDGNRNALMANNQKMASNQSQTVRFSVEPLSSTSLQSQSASAEGRNKGLMLLAAIGLVVLQLRRKHKSLPQRFISSGSNARTALPN